jgi:hypothetical protein
VTSYLEIRKSDFYKIESNVDGKRFVTARGWVDLSDMIKLFEKNSFPVDETLVGQYLQDAQIAKSFAVYYDLFNKYRSDYQVDAIMAGEATEDIRSRAREARFDERLSLLSLLTDAVGDGIRRVLRDERALNEIVRRLRAYKAQFATADPEEARKRLIETAEAITRSIAVRQQANALPDEEARAGMKAARLLEDFVGELGDDVAQPFAWLGQRFDRESAALQQDAADVCRQLDNIFAFCETVFPEGQELLLLVTEFSVDASSARFIGKYGCEAYFRYNRELMFYERNRELNREISALKLDLTDADAEGHCGHCIQNHEEGRRDRK